MNTLVLLLISIAVLFCGYVMYGGWLVKQWGVGEGDIPTPAHALEDGVDYVPAKAATTRIRVRYEKMMKRRFARRDMLAEITSPMDWPL